MGDYYHLKRSYKDFDFVLVVMILTLAMFGLQVLGSALRVNIHGAYGMYAQQRIWIATGFCVMLVAAFVDYHFILRFYIPLYIGIVAFLLALFVLGNVVANTVRWAELFGQTIQPSEFAKVIIIVCLAAHIEKKGDEINSLFNFSLLLLLTVIPVALVYLQPSLSASGVLFVISAIVIFVSGIKAKNLLLLILFTAPVVTFILADLTAENRVLVDKIMQQYQIERIESMLNPELDEDNYRQLESSRHAIGSGQLYGKGIYQGTHSQRTAYSENDFIFAVVGEEFGFVGCVAVILLTFLIVAKCLYTAFRAPDLPGRIISAGAAAMFFFQSFFHVGVTIGLMPVTGVTYPFFSYGGSSMWACMAAAGLVINVGMSKERSMFED